MRSSEEQISKLGRLEEGNTIVLDMFEVAFELWKIYECSIE
jgi:hypothetical protein